MMMWSLCVIFDSCFALFNCFEDVCGLLVVWSFWMYVVREREDEFVGFENDAFLR